MRIRTIGMTLIVLLMAGVAFDRTATGQEPDEAHAEHHPEEAQAEEAQAQVDAEAPGMMARCRQTMAEREGMMERMRETETRLNSLLAEMNAAEGDQKIDRMAEVVNELVARLGPMPGEMMRMQQEMMSHMSEAMRSGEGMCPMMEMMGTMGGAGQASPDQE